MELKYEGLIMQKLKSQKIMLPKFCCIQGRVYWVENLKLSTKTKLEMVDTDTKAAVERFFSSGVEFAKVWQSEKKISRGKLYSIFSGSHGWILRRSVKIELKYELSIMQKLSFHKILYQSSVQTKVGIEQLKNIQNVETEIFSRIFKFRSCCVVIKKIRV